MTWPTAVAVRCRFLMALLAAVSVVRSGVDARGQERGAIPAFEIVPVVEPLFTINEATFNRMMYGSGQSGDSLRERLDRALALKIADTNRTLGLSQDQRSALELAGRGDIKHRFDRIEDRRDVINRRLTQEEYLKLRQDLQAMQNAHGDDLFGEGSLYAKALKAMLSDVMAARYRKVEREKRQILYRARVEQYVAGIDNGIGLTADQRRRFVAVLLEETQPPKIFSNYDLLLVQYQAARLPEARLRPIFDELQWRVLGQRFGAARGIEQTINIKDYLPDPVMAEEVGR
jgi:hypothetical protein